MIAACALELPTLLTPVDLLSKVDSKNFLMTNNSYSLSERIRWLSTVNSLMLNKVRTLSEGFPTCSAFIGLFSSVNPLVLNKL